MTANPHLDDSRWWFYIAVMITSIVFVGAVLYGVEALNAVLRANTAGVDTEYVCGMHCQQSPVATWDQFRALVVMIGFSFGAVCGVRGWRIWRRNKTSDEV